MSLVDFEEVPEARSFCSTSRTLRPRPAASRAMPAPLMPPPMMARSKSAMLLLLIRRCGAAWGRSRVGLKPGTAHRPGLEFAGPAHDYSPEQGVRRSQANPRRWRIAMSSFQDRHVVVTGGTGALGTAVVAALLEAGATCHVPYIAEAEASRFPHRDHARVVLVGGGDLADEAEVDRLCGGVAKLWASIHLAGGFAFGPIVDTTAEALRHQIDMNFVTCFLCCRAATQSFMRQGGGGRIVNVAAGPALEGRVGANITACGG